MATREQAILNARQRAQRRAQAYYAIQAKNGQWMCERAEFVEGPVGRMAYPPARQRVKFSYTGEQMES